MGHQGSYILNPREILCIISLLISSFMLFSVLYFLNSYFFKRTSGLVFIVIFLSLSFDTTFWAIYLALSFNSTNDFCNHVNFLI